MSREIMAECLEEAFTLASNKRPLTDVAIATLAVALYQERMRRCLFANDAEVGALRVEQHDIARGAKGYG